MNPRFLLLTVGFIISYHLQAQDEGNCKWIYYMQDNLNKSVAFNSTPILKTKYTSLFDQRKNKLKISFIKKEDNYVEFRLVSKRSLLHNRMFIGTEQPIAFVFNDKSYFIVNFKSNPLAIKEKTIIPFIKRKHDYNTITLDDELLKLLTTKNVASIEVRNPNENNPNIIRMFDVEARDAKELMKVARCFSEAKHSSR